MTRPHRHKNNSGVTLLEMMVYCALLIIIINAGMQITLAAGRVSAVNALAKDRLIAVQEVDALFRDAARGTSGVLDRAGAYTTGENTVVLRLPEEGRARVVGAVLQPDQFSVLDLEEENGAWEITDMRTHPLPLRNIRVSVPDNSAALLELAYTIEAERGERMPNPVRHQTLAVMHNTLVVTGSPHVVAGSPDPATRTTPQGSPNNNESTTP